MNLLKCAANVVWNDLRLNSAFCGSAFYALGLPLVTYFEVLDLLKGKVANSSRNGLVPFDTTIILCLVLMFSSTYNVHARVFELLVNCILLFNLASK